MSVQAIGFSLMAASASTDALEPFEQEPLISQETKTRALYFNRASMSVITVVLSVGLSVIPAAIYHQITLRSQFDELSLLHLGAHVLPMSVFLFINLSRILQTLFSVCDDARRSNEQANKTEQCHLMITKATRGVYSIILQICLVFFLLLLTHSWGTSNLCSKK